MSNISSSLLETSNIQKNVFVTQINDREDENDDSIVKHVIVKESSQDLLKTGLNTFQSTLVIKKDNQLDLVDSDLLIKRHGYEKQMAICIQKKQQLLLKQQELLDQMKSFDSFIKENDAKRRRALVKYQNEIRLIDQQKLIQKELKKEINETKALHEKLLKKVQHNKKYEEFLLKVVENLPPDYIKVSENILTGLIMRYNTLFSTNEVLLNDMSAKSEESQFYTNLITKLKENNSRKLLQNNYRLSQMYEEYEKLKEQLERGEQHFKILHGDIRAEIFNFGLTLRAIDNITKKCIRRFDETLTGEGMENKLEKIQNYIITSRQIIEMVKDSKEKPNPHLPPISEKTIQSSQPKKLIIKKSPKDKPR